MTADLFESILIANSGENACRIISTCHRLGIREIARALEDDVDVGVAPGDFDRFIGVEHRDLVLANVEGVLTFHDLRGEAPIVRVVAQQVHLLCDRAAIDRDDLEVFLVTG